jgi:hypothetical protein
MRPAIALMTLASMSALPSMRPRYSMGAPSDARNCGKSGKIASLETSFSRLARPRSHTSFGSARRAGSPRAGATGGGPGPSAGGVSS